MTLFRWLTRWFSRPAAPDYRVPGKPHPANVPGQFYVEEGCCIACGVPEEIAPDLFGWVEGENHCFVKRQPSGAAELSQMLDAMCSSEVDCIRARFADRDLFKLLEQRHHEHLVDELAEEHREGGN